MFSTYKMSTEVGEWSKEIMSTWLLNDSLAGGFHALTARILRNTELESPKKTL